MKRIYLVILIHNDATGSESLLYAFESQQEAKEWVETLHSEGKKARIESTMLFEEENNG